VGCENGIGFSSSENTQSIKCKDVETHGCINRINQGDRNLQNIHCTSVGDSLGCINTVDGDDNTQKSYCKFVSDSCINTANGNENSQEIVCISSERCKNESNSPVSGNTQKTICIKSTDFF